MRAVLIVHQTARQPSPDTQGCCPHTGVTLAPHCPEHASCDQPGLQPSYTATPCTHWPPGSSTRILWSCPSLLSYASQYCRTQGSATSVSRTVKQASHHSSPAWEECWERCIVMCCSAMRHRCQGRLGLLPHWKGLLGALPSELLQARVRSATGPSALQGEGSTQQLRQTLKALHGHYGTVLKRRSLLLVLAGEH